MRKRGKPMIQLSTFNRATSCIERWTLGVRWINPGMKFILFLSLPLYALDQLTKRMVLRFISPDEPHVLVSDFFSLVYVTNNGAAFGSFRGNNTFFIAISCVALVVVLGLLLRARIPDRWRDHSLAGEGQKLPQAPRTKWR